MKASSTFACAVAFCSLVASPAIAMVTNSGAVAGASNPLVVKADFVQGHEAVYGVPTRQAVIRAEASSAMAQRYFDVDVIITLGALALASGAFVAMGIAGSRRRFAVQPVASPREGWQNEVMQALEADLAQFTVGLRQAA